MASKWLVGVFLVLGGCSDDGVVSGESDSTPGTTSGGATMSSSTAAPPGTSAQTASASGGTTTEQEGSTGIVVGTSTGDPSESGTQTGTGTTGTGSGTGTGTDTGGMTTTGLMPGECNEMLGVGCLATEFCDYPDDNCGADDHGTCQPRPNACTDEVDPVCGCDGITHGNPCEAPAAGTDIESLGPC